MHWWNWVIFVAGMVAVEVITWLRLRYQERKLRQQFEQLLSAKGLAAEEGRWEDWDSLDLLMDEHFARRDAWLRNDPGRLYKLDWDDVRERGD